MRRLVAVTVVLTDTPVALSARGPTRKHINETINAAAHDAGTRPVQRTQLVLVSTQRLCRAGGSRRHPSSSYSKSKDP